jgi:succinyl-diaminopimelate desuccinylase
MKFLEKNLKKLGFKTKILEFKDKGFEPVKNLYARLGSKGPNFMFAGHVDIVPPGNIKDWTINPFKPSIKKGHLIGRGANDMKSSIAAFVSAISTFLSKNKKFDGSISLLITGDEEGDAINGTKKVVKYLKKRKEKINFCLVGEPTNPNKLGEMIKIGRRGSLTGKLIIFGLQGHVAYPHRANNPSTTIVKILKELKDIKFDRGTKNFQPTNLEVTKINVNNTADNVIPAIAEATFNIRFNDKHSSKSIKKRLNKIFKKISKKYKSKFKIDYRVSGEAFLTKPNKTTFMIQNVIKKITKIRPKLSTTGGTSDLRFIKAISPGLEFGLVGKTMHKVDEAVSLKDLKNLTKIYVNILQNYFK